LPQIWKIAGFCHDIANKCSLTTIVNTI